MSNPEENSMSPGSPGRCNGATDALLAQVGDKPAHNRMLISSNAISKLNYAFGQLLNEV